MRVLLVNAGSSSLKCTLMEPPGRVLARASADWAGPITHYERIEPDGQRVSEEVSFRRHGDAVRKAITELVSRSPAHAAGASDRLAAIGHRIVHGGEFSAAARLTPEMRSRISALGELAPLHNPPALESLAAAESLLPDVPHVAVFDTAFHATLPDPARSYPLCREWTERWGIRRFGFHGLSYAYSTQRAAELLLRRVEEIRLVICHLGHGCSASAVRYGRSVDTTMGFTPLEGLMMATRSGSIDPSIVTHLQLRHGLSAGEVEALLNHQSGVLGVSGLSADMREVLAAAHAGDERARLAVDMYTHRVRQAIGGLAVTLGGLDALVFTGGVGENSAEIRLEICRGLECLGLELDTEVNAHCDADVDLARPGSRARILAIKAREDVAMLADVLHAVRDDALRTAELGARVDRRAVC